MAGMDNIYDEYHTAESYGSGSYTSFADVDALAVEHAESRIMLMGPRRSGKSSIQRVVFQKMSPHETLFLDPTQELRVKEINNNWLVRFQILDFPGNFEFDPKSKVDPNVVFRRGGALVFVMDGQDEEVYADAIDYFIGMAKIAYKVNPHISFEILIHKVDGDSYLSDDHKIDCQREIQQQITEELNDAKLPIHPRFYLTSIYDHSIFEAFSKIVQKLTNSMASLENTLDNLIARCNMEKAFLFDVVSKIYVATDSNPVDPQVYELCSDMIDVVIDVECIYGAQPDTIAFDTDASSVIKLSNNYYLYLREVSKYLALVGLMRGDMAPKASIVDHNVRLLRNAVFGLEEKQKKRKAAAKPPYVLPK